MTYLRKPSLAEHKSVLSLAAQNPHTALSDFTYRRGVNGMLEVLLR